MCARTHAPADGRTSRKHNASGLIERTGGCIRTISVGNCDGHVRDSVWQIQVPDLQNILRQSYDYLTIMPKLRSTYDGRRIYKKILRRTQGFS